MNKIQIIFIGCILLCFSISVCSAESKIDTQDMERLFEEFRTNARKDNLGKCNTLGDSNAKGIGWTRSGCKLLYMNPPNVDDIQEAEVLFQKAADLNEPYAQYYLGGFYKNTDPEKAKQLYLKAAKQNLAVAQTAYGRQLISEKKSEEAKPWLEKAAKNGDLKATHYLGVLLVFYALDATDDTMRKEGCQHILSAAQKGHYPAQLSMIGSWQDFFSDEHQWFLEEAEKGNSDAYIMAGMIYENGVGVEKDELQAKQWYEKAAQEKSLPGLTRLYMLISKDDDRNEQQ